MTNRPILRPRFTSSIDAVPIVPGQFIATSDGNLYVDMESERIHCASFTVVSTMAELETMGKDVSKLYCVDDSLWRWDGESLIQLGGIASVIKSGRQVFDFSEIPDGRFILTYTYTGDDPATTEINVGTVKPLLEVIFELATVPQGSILDSLVNVTYFNNFVKALRDCDVQSLIFSLEGVSIRSSSETGEAEFVQDAHLSAIAGKLENVTTQWHSENPAKAELKGIWMRPNQANSDELFYWRFYVDGTVKQDISPLVKDAPHDGKLYGRKNGQWDEITSLYWAVDDQS